MEGLSEKQKKILSMIKPYAISVINDPNTEKMIICIVLGALEFDIEDKVIDILVSENSGFDCLEDAYSAIKEIVDKIELFGKFKKDFDPSNILDYVGLTEKN